MGYGGIIKTVVRVAASVVGGMVCGPPCAAIGSAVATGATGGSFKEALMAGATSYIGASISKGVTGAIGDASTTAAQNAATAEFGTTVINGAGQSVNLAIGDVIPQGFSSSMGAAGEIFNGAGQGLVGEALAGIGKAAAPVNANISQFGDTLNETFGNAGGTNVSAFDTFSANAQSGLSSLGFDLSDVAPLPFDIAGATAGGVAEFTLNQALLDQTGAYDDILAQKYTPQQIQILKREARNAQSQVAFDTFLGNTDNPFGTDEAGLAEFNQAIAAGVERRNTDIGANVTQEQFDAGFSDLTGQGILDQELGIRKQGFNNTLDQTFTGDAFGNIDDDIINSIVEERSGPARQQVSNFAARGNLNPIGGGNANKFLDEQTEGASQRVRDIGAGVLGQNQQAVDTLKGTAQSQIGNFQLGDDLFDVTPFAEQRSNLVNERQGTLGSDISSAIGNEPIFDISGALQAGGRSQGAVSGTAPNKSFLDAIAAREQAANSTKRGIGTRGSGAF